jgi:hypothetical protein
MFSGGKASWFAARRVQEVHPGESITLLFADTKVEDPDLYRFLDESSAALDLPLVKVADGRDIWQVFKDQKFLGNNRVPLCSRILKQEVSRRWVEENCDPSDTTIYFGIDWSEAHRAERIPKHWKPWKVEFPLLWKPLMDGRDADLLLADAVVAPPPPLCVGCATQQLRRVVRSCRSGPLQLGAPCHPFGLRRMGGKGGGVAATSGGQSVNHA